ncbi:MAG: PPC domain-containing protein [Gemmataceae bacterium]|nr:PPC domain-containing protein [Gemmata sp.]MDW8197605.1 PPC domain-containing protein [Gemmataceae bacterium]
MNCRHVVALGVVLALVTVASAQPAAPQLLSVFPPGAKAGATVEITLSGHFLEGSEKLLISGPGFTADPVGTVNNPKAQPGQPTATMKFRLTVPPEASGTYDLRVLTQAGLSNPRAFVVTNQTEVVEREPNNDVDQAQKIDVETTVSGVISAPTDVDYIAFTAKKGQALAILCLCSSIDSKLYADVMVSGPDGKPLVANRGYREGDAVVSFIAPTDGEYRVRVAQFAYTSGGYDHFYRLTVTTQKWRDAIFPPVATNERPSARRWPITPSAAPLDLREAAEFVPHPLLATRQPLVVDNDQNHSANSAQDVTPPCDIAGRILTKNERDWYQFRAHKGEVWTIEVFAERIGSPVDAYFWLTDEKGKVITEQDDGPETLSPHQFYTKSDDPGRYRFAVPADGLYKVMVSTRAAGTQFGVRDQYVLRLAKEQPDFRVAIMPLSPHIPEGGTVPKGGAVVLAVYAFRFDGFNEPIELTATGLPQGVTCPPQVIGPGQTRGCLVLLADPDAADWDGFITVHARSGERQHTAKAFSVIWPAIGVQPGQVPNVPMLTRQDRGEGLAVAVRGQAPYRLIPKATQLTAPAGGKLEVTLQVIRDEKFKDPIAVIAATPGFGPPPKGNAPFPPIATAAPETQEVKLNLDIPANLPPGPYTLILRGQSAAPPPKGGNNAPLRAIPTFAAAPITVEVKAAPKKK